MVCRRFVTGGNNTNTALAIFTQKQKLTYENSCFGKHAYMRGLYAAIVRTGRQN
jgi:hypothetical protein